VLGRGLACLLLVGCSFESRVSTVDASTEGIDAPDAAPLVPLWIVAGMSRGPTPLVRIFPFDGEKFETPCAEQTSSPTGFALRDFAKHPSLKLVYALDRGFRSMSLACGGMTFAGSTDVGGVREIQQVAHDAATGVGFFTAGGTGAVGVYRYDTATNGTPTVAGDADAPANSGALALDVTNKQLFVAGGLGTAGGYVLSGSTLTLPTTYTTASMCMRPVRLIPTGANHLLAFCNDQATIRRYNRNPFETDTAMSTVGALGAVDAVAPLPGDRAIAARAAPTMDLVVVNNNAGLPMWGVGTQIPSRVLAIGASNDGHIVATARVVGPAASEIAVWSVEGDSVKLVAVTQTDTVVTALAVTTPGS
jgi:hypothetical protein